MAFKQFAVRLEEELNSLGMPEPLDERTEAFSQFLKIKPFKAKAYLMGELLPNQEDLSSLANELDVNPEWLVGKSTDKHIKTLKHH